LSLRGVGLGGDVADRRASTLASLTHLLLAETVAELACSTPGSADTSSSPPKPPSPLSFALPTPLANFPASSPRPPRSPARGPPPPLEMANPLNRKQRTTDHVASLGPDDPEALLGPDLAPRTRPFSVVSNVDPGMAALQPLLLPGGAAVSKVGPRKRAGNGEQRNLVEGHQGHLRSDPIEVRLLPSVLPLRAISKVLAAAEARSGSSAR